LVVDPSCGGGAFLLAAADALADRGVEPSDVIDRRIVGVEVDKQSAALAKAALCEWAKNHGTSAEPRVILADAIGETDLRGLVLGSAVSGPTHATSEPGLEGVDLVVGNPPFLSQLDADTAMDHGQRQRLQERFGFRAAYTDVSAFHLLAAAGLLAPGGVVCMIQPQSVLGARDAAPVRGELLDRCDLVGLWISAASHFTAQVRVCAPILRATSPKRGAGVEAGATALQTLVHRETGNYDEALPAEPPLGTAPWSRLLSRAQGVPVVTAAASGRVVGDVARVTAGFRDEFYAVAGCTKELADAGTSGTKASELPRVVTSGLVDPRRVLWGQRPVRIAGRRLTEPVLDLDQLEAENPRVRRWVGDRLVPKVLVATQTKVLEAAVDEVGDLVPLTPVLSIEPTTPEVTPQMLCALLSSPAVSALAHARAAGTGQSADAIRVSASAISALPIPADLDRWRSLTEELPLGGPESSLRPEVMASLAPLLNRITGGAISWAAKEEDQDTNESLLLEWWLQRLPRPRGR
jgi:hypothetical protein